MNSSLNSHIKCIYVSVQTETHKQTYTHADIHLFVGSVFKWKIVCQLPFISSDEGIKGERGDDNELGKAKAG